MNAIELLKSDHKKVRELLTELEATSNRATAKRVTLLNKINTEIKVHSTIEEEIFYPAFKNAAKKAEDQKLYFEALEEHRAAGDLVLPDLLGTDVSSDQFGGRAKVLKDLIEHHAKEEEDEMFPRAQEVLSSAELEDLGNRMMTMKVELQHQMSERAAA